jgi:glycosyltransferase involved in cell wall biosynthesis
MSQAREMKKARIVYIVDEYDHEYCGTERQLVELIKGLDRARYDPVLCVLRESPYLASHWTACDWHCAGIPKIRDIRNISRLYKWLQNIRGENGNIVHTFFNDSSIIGPIPARLAGYRVVVSRRDLGYWYTPVRKWLLRLNARLVDQYVANCNAVKNVTVVNESPDCGKVAVIYNGYQAARDPTACSLREMLELPTHAKIVLVVANFRPLKRIEDAVEGFARAAENNHDWHLIVAGEDSSELHAADLMQAGPAVKLADRVHFSGRIDNIAALANQADIGMLVSESEGLSNAIMEGMAGSLPMVCTDVGGNPELVVEGETGFLVDVGDVGAIAARLLRLMNDRTLREQMGEAGNNKIQNLCEMRRMISSYEALYSSVIQIANGTR